MVGLFCCLSLFGLCCALARSFSLQFGGRFAFDRRVALASSWGFLDFGHFHPSQVFGRSCDSYVFKIPFLFDLPRFPSVGKRHQFRVDDINILCFKSLSAVGGRAHD